MFKNGMRPIHPGEVLREDYLKPMDMSANALAKQLHVPASRINDIVLERRGITADTALRLSRFFGSDPQSWLNLQTAYDLRVAERERGDVSVRGCRGAWPISVLGACALVCIVDVGLLSWHHHLSQVEEEHRPRC